MDTDERFEKLEIKVTYLEDYVDKLNSVILDQEKEIEDFKLVMEHIKRQIEEGPGKTPEHKKPPHY